MQPSDQFSAAPETATPVSANAASGRAYHTPVFVHHGSSADIVRTNQGFGSDGGAFPDDTAS